MFLESKPKKKGKKLPSIILKPFFKTATLKTGNGKALGIKVSRIKKSEFNPMSFKLVKQITNGI